MQPFLVLLLYHLGMCSNHFDYSAAVTVNVMDYNLYAWFHAISQIRDLLCAQSSLILCAC